MEVMIVGGVAGDTGMIARLRENDETTEITMLEREPYISYAGCGLSYYIGGMTTDKDALQPQTPERFHVRFDMDMHVDSQVVSVDTGKRRVIVRYREETYEESYDELVLPPGAGPVRSGTPGIGENHVLTLRDIPNTYIIHDFVEEHKLVSCAVIGIGLIGLGVAENLAEQGIRVSVIEGATHVMPPIDMDMAHVVRNYVRAQGIGLYLGHTYMVTDKSGIILDNGVRVLAGMVIMSIGVRPDTGFLKDSAIEPGTGGEILVNQYMETSAKDVRALRDTVSVKHVVSGQKVLIPPASPANKQGRIVGDNLYGRKTVYKGSQGASVTRFLDMTVAVTGEKERSLITQGRSYRKVIITFVSRTGYYPGGGMVTIKTVFDPVTAVTLGAQIVGGKNVDEQIDDPANTVRFKLSGYDLQGTKLAYVSPFSPTRDLTSMAGYVIGNTTEGLMKPSYLEDLDGTPENAVRLDVHTVKEYIGGTTPGSINIPLDGLREYMDEPDLTRDMYITCQIGPRDYLVQRILDQAGARAWNLSDRRRLYEMMAKDEQPMTTAATMCTECGMEVDVK